MTVARNAEIITAYCTACAEGMRTSQVVCYQRNVAVGEVVGMRMNNDKEDRKRRLKAGERRRNHDG